MAGTSARAKKRARSALHNRPLQYAGRAGIVVSGLLNAIVGVIAITIAIQGHGTPREGGALDQLAHLPGGAFLLWFAAAALAALAAWQLVQTVAVRERDLRTRWIARLRHGAQGLGYGVLALGAAGFAIRGPTGNASAVTAALLATVPGVVLLAGVGAVIAASGVAFVVIGMRRSFADHDLIVPDGRAGTAVIVTGMVGYIGRGVALVILGVLWFIAAVSFDAGATSGLDGALAELARKSFGAVLLAGIAFGFLAFAAYCGVRARHANLSP